MMFECSSKCRKSWTEQNSSGAGLQRWMGSDGVWVVSSDWALGAGGRSLGESMEAAGVDGVQGGGLGSE